MSRIVELIEHYGGPSLYFREYAYTGKMNTNLESMGMEAIPGRFDSDSLESILSLSSESPASEDNLLRTYLTKHCTPGSLFMTKVISTLHDPQNVNSKKFLISVTKNAYKKEGPMRACEFVRLARHFMDFWGMDNSVEELFSKQGINAVFIYDSKFRGQIGPILKRECELACKSKRRFEWLIRKSPGMEREYSSAMRVVCVCAVLSSCLSLSTSHNQFVDRFKSLMSVYTSENDKMSILYFNILDDALSPEKYRSRIVRYMHYMTRALVHADEVYGVELESMTRAQVPGSIRYAMSQLLFSENV